MGEREFFFLICKKLLIKMQKNKKVHPPKKISTPAYPPPRNLAKASWAFPLDFQTVFIFVFENNK
jgi:hypothetical protein